MFFEEEPSAFVGAEVDGADTGGIHVSTLPSDRRSHAEVLTIFFPLRNGPAILQLPIRSVFGCLVLDPVLLEIWIVQVFLQGPHERNRCLGSNCW